MRIEDFGEMKTGQLVPITAGAFDRQSWAFVPNPLPPQLRFSEELWNVIADAQTAVGELMGVGQTLAHARLLLPPLQKKEAIASSQIEGTYATAQQLMFAEMGEAEDSAQEPANSPAREVAKNYKAVKKGVDETSDGKSLNCDLIKRLHGILLSGVADADDKLPGQFRDKQVFVRGPESGRRYIPPPPAEMHECLEALDKYLASNDHSCRPLVRAFLVHYQLEAIHPFCDGNGRVGRLFLALNIQRWMNMGLPLLFLSEYFGRTKPEYTNRLYRISAAGEWNEWVQYCLIGVIQQAGSATKKIKQLDKMRREYRKQVEGKKRLPEIVDQLFAHPMTRIVDVERRFKIAYQTAREDLSFLETLGIIEEVGRRRPKTFLAKDVCGVAFSDPS